MKANLIRASILIIMIFGGTEVFAQRFTSEEQMTRPGLKADTGFINAERSYLALKAGDLDNARKYLSLADASNPFAMYVRATLTPDATQASGIYKLIVNEFPDKPIAREALMQLYKYHYAAGDYRLARTDYLQLRKYPGSTQLTDPAGLSDKMPAEKDTLLERGVSQNPVVAPQPPVGVPPSTSTQEESPVPSEEGYAVQLGVFSTRANAEKLVTQLRSKNISASVSMKPADGRTLYAVTTGDFRTRDAAETFAARLKSRSIDCIVVNTGESRE
jgi:hypothetical protein